MLKQEGIYYMVKEGKWRQQLLHRLQPLRQKIKSPQWIKQSTSGWNPIVFPVSTMSLPLTCQEIR